MTTPNRSVDALLDLAARLGAFGVELRNDLGRDIFGGHSPQDVGQQASERGLKILAVAEIKAFNSPDVDMQKAKALIRQAQACGALGVALIPAVLTHETARDVQREMLRTSLTRLRPLLEEHQQVGLIEPIGFGTSTLRFKQDVADVLHAIGRPACFGIIHDTFHHCLAESDTLQADLTMLMHISGVDDPAPQVDELEDKHRVLVGPRDRLGSVAQIKALADNGYDGPISFEAFAPDIHNLTDPSAALAGSIDHIAHSLAENAGRVRATETL
ncbi:TIM barrel protein [uncultured Tateyamaria sp.]|uniref:TIM barrel protein n=1 Tax=uncultured Tateyamaria sp. TaxID=455651 RepID=UPI0026201365|nr:TIM barrel protein [uncultured Tateyamaria sp.]